MLPGESWDTCGGLHSLQGGLSRGLQKRFDHEDRRLVGLVWQYLLGWEAIDVLQVIARVVYGHAFSLKYAIAPPRVSSRG
jgi:hypothetical protein